MLEAKTLSGLFDREKIRDWLAALAAATLAGLWGCLAVFNATCGSDRPFYYLSRQCVWLACAVALMAGCSLLAFRLYRTHRRALALAFWAPLALTPFIGVEAHGMRGWFAFGISEFRIFIQPSELAKPIYVLALCAACFGARREPRRFLLASGVAALWLVPVLAQPDYGTATVYLAGFAIAYWLSGGRVRYLLFAGGVAALVLLIATWRYPYIYRRFFAFLTPTADPTGAGWHMTQFHIALGRGGFWGQGLGKALWAKAFLPLSHSDSAFAALTESIGLVGALPLIAVFIAFLWAVRVVVGSGESPSFAGFFALTLTGMIVFQAFLHIGVNVGMLPTTGVTLPFFSYGGSSLVGTMFACGMIVSASQAIRRTNG